MNLHLPSDGPNLVELEVDGDAMIIVRRIGSDRRVRVIRHLAGPSPRLVVLAGTVFCVFGVGIGYSVASRTADTDPRYDVPGHFPAMSSSFPRIPTPMPPGVALAMPRPYSDLPEPATSEQTATQVPGSVPATIMQHLSQRPVVMPPSSAQSATPVSPASGAAHGSNTGNAFGLE